MALGNLLDTLGNFIKPRSIGMSGVVAATLFSKLKGLESDAEGIDAIANIFDRSLAPLHYLARGALNFVFNNVTFIRVGDSTKSMQSSEWQTYDKLIFEQLNIIYYNNADPSQTAYDWLNNIDQNTFNQCIENCTGIGGDRTIIEFSLGLNDYTYYGNTVDSKPQVKQILIDSINAIKLAKPKAYIYLASPHYAQNNGRKQVLGEVYKEIANEMNLFLVDGQAIPIGSTYDYNNTDYYNDGTHLNQFGMLRLNYYILNKILPIDVLKCIDVNEYILPQETGNLALGLPIKVGLWNTGVDYFDVIFNSNSNYRWIEVPIISPEITQRMKFKHQGNRNQIFFVYLDDTVERITSSLQSDGSNAFFVPHNVKTLYVNLSTDGSNYDLLNDVPIIEYYLRDRPFIPYTELVQGFKSNLSYSRERNGRLVDDYGFYGKENQSLTIDINNKMKWA